VSNEWLLVRKEAEGTPKAKSNGVYPVPQSQIPELEEIRERVADEDARLEAICSEIAASSRVTGATGGRRIAVAVAKKYGVTFRELISRNREPLLIRARQEAATEMKRYTSLSHAQIGTILGGRDHSTVSFALRQHKKRTGEVK